MTRYGQEVETRFLDKDESKVEYIRNIKDFDVHSAFKRTSVRVHVHNQKEEMVEFLTFSKLIAEKIEAGTLVRGDRDPSLRPTFVVEYPKTSIDGSYFVIRTFTELML